MPNLTKLELSEIPDQSGDSLTLDVHLTGDLKKDAETFKRLASWLDFQSTKKKHFRAFGVAPHKITFRAYSSCCSMPACQCPGWPGTALLCGNCSHAQGDHSC
jgi:hypothetical protein